ncbi:Thioredoxin [Popillia japonica]|uniref:Thioredoxin n=1 Tax=Popillia japonica TaxID=7064 RepID=A0AAW1ISG8_POPJA
MFSIFSLLLIATVVTNIQASLETVTDDELLNLIKTEKYVIVLFSKRDCEICDNYENELSSLREDLVDSLNAWVVKVENSHMTRLYTPTKEPVVIFFRHGVPLLYDGPLNDEVLLHTFTDNKEPIVKELTDDTFEHLTQAATGATTGDWFVMFYNNDCIDCQRLQARLEAVGAKLKNKVNIARVNRGTNGAATARRFDVFHVPTFILFRQGKMYRYHIQKYDIPSFVSFAQEWHKNVSPEKVPLPKTPFDDLTSAIAVYIRENTWLLYVGIGTFCIGIIASMLSRRGKIQTQEKPKKTKKEK